MDYTILMLIVMVAIMYFLMIRPENKRKKIGRASCRERVFYSV